MTTRRLHPLALAGGLLAGLLGLVVLVAAVQVVGDAAQGSASCGRGPTTVAATGLISATGLEEIPSRLVPVFQQAAGAYGLGQDGWAWLAAVNRIETDFGRDTATSPTGAVGWMQFEPATWAEYGVDGNGDGRRDPYDPVDAIGAAARYLRALGAPADWERAVRGYNGGPANAGSASTLGYWEAAARSASAYLGAGGPPPATASPPSSACEPCPAGAGPSVPDALAAPVVPPTGAPAATTSLPASDCAAGGAVPLAPGDRARIEPDGRAIAPAGAPAAVRAMIVAGNQLIGTPYIYGGGHADFRPAAGYDCSSAVSWALHGAAYLTAPEDSVTLEGFGDPGAGLWVTVYANPVHAFVYVAGIRLDTSPQAGDGRFGELGPRWRPATRSTAGFVARHPPGL